MKKTKINFGTILLMIYAVIAFMMPQVVQGFFAYFSSGTSAEGGTTGELISNPEALLSVMNSFLGVSTAFNFVTIISIIGFGTVLLAGKRWGAAAMGTTMATASAVNAVPLISCAFYLCIQFMSMYGAASGGDDLGSAIATAGLIIIIFILTVVTVCVGAVMLPSFLGWALYAMIGAFANRANNKGKTAVFAMLLKAPASLLLAFAGVNQILIPIILLFVLASNETFGSVEDGMTIVVNLLLVFSFVIVVALVSVFILFLGIILSVKCKPDVKAEKRKRESALIIATEPQINEAKKEETAEKTALQTEVTEAEATVTQTEKNEPVES